MMRAKMKFDNPFTDILMCFQRMYGSIECYIQFDPSLPKGIGKTMGDIVFPFDGSAPVISISSKISVDNAMEILIHELAHLKCGPMENHGKEWTKTFKAIVKQYNKETKEKAIQEGLKVKY